jgi:hypothetical protein
MINEPEIAFRIEPERPGIAVRVNFGIFAGREATPAEIDELALLLRPDLSEISIVSEIRHEIGRHSEAAVHQLRIEVADASLPADPEAREQLAALVVQTSTFWARMCVAERHAEL